MLAGAVLIAMGARANAAAPVLDYLFPGGGQRGSTVAVTATGKFEKWPVHVWVDAPGIHVSAGEATGSLTFKIDQDVNIGPHLIRLYGDDGASDLRCFVIGDGPEVMEVEPNDQLGKAQVVAKLPVTINGRLDKPGDVDCYAVELEAGACLVASVQGRRLGSPIDPMLHVLDADGIEVGFAHDGLGIDPMLAFRADKAGRYVVRVSAFAYPPAADVKLAGGRADIYRLHLTTGPVGHFCMPSGVRRNCTATLRLLGWNLSASGTGGELSVDANSITSVEKYLNVPAPGGDGWLRVEVGDEPEWLDSEARKADVVVPLPVNISGLIGAPGGQHRIRIDAKKGERLRFEVRAGAMNSMLDAVLRIESSEGKLLASANGGGGPADPALDWTAPADGRYSVVLADLFHKGGPDYVYRLGIKRPRPSVEALIDSQTYRVVRGAATAVKVKVSRKDGHVGGLVVVATGLPEGVSATSAEVLAAGGEVTLVLSAGVGAKPFGGVVHFMVLSADPAKPEVYPAMFSLRPEKEAGQEWIEKTWDAWLTVPADGPTTAPATLPSTRTVE
jgi:hypothetical protein